jgi:cell division protease FtsH
MASNPDPSTPPPNPAAGSTPPTAKRFGGIPSGWAVILVIGLLLVFLYGIDLGKKTITFTQFTTLYETGQIESLKIMGVEKIEGKVRNADVEPAKSMGLSGGHFQVNLPVQDNQLLLLDRIREADAKHKPANADPVSIARDHDQLALFGPLLWLLLPLLIFLLFFAFYVIPRMRDSGPGGFLNSYVRSPARRYEKGKSKTTFDDIAGMDAAKRELQEVVDFLKDPSKFTRLGAQVPKGVLLVGPPGTGKTLLAKAVAGEANVPFYSINGSEFIQMFVGVGASRVRDLFKTAKENSPCVIFVDEIDAVGRMRGAGVGGGSDEREQTLNQILSEMDGFSPTETVIVLAATNRPDVLDAALLRPGRFDRHVTVDRPTWQGRLSILKVHTRNKPLSDDVDLERIARAMIGMSGADLRNLCNEAALVATRNGKNRIGHGDFDAAADRVRLGAKREEAYSDQEKRRTAYHEAGHALCALFEPKSDPLDRVSIIPRGRTGGVTMFSPDEDRIDFSASELMARLITLMGGRAADTIVHGEALSGAIQDLKMATRMARMMVTQYGMSERLGPVSYRAGEDHVFLGKEIVESRDFSEGTARIIDEEIQRILNDAEARAVALLKHHRHELDLLANALLVAEELDKEGVERVLKGLPPIDPAPATISTSEPAPVAAAEPAVIANLPPKLAFG